MQCLESMPQLIYQPNFSSRWPIEPRTKVSWRFHLSWHHEAKSLVIESRVPCNYGYLKSTRVYRYGHYFATNYCSQTFIYHIPSVLSRFTYWVYWCIFQYLKEWKNVKKKNECGYLKHIKTLKIYYHAGIFFFAFKSPSKKYFFNIELKTV